MSLRTHITKTKGALAGKYARGRYAVGIDHRSGFKVLLKDLKFEPGTNFLVTSEENDGDYSLVLHAQNFPPEKKVERIALRWSFPDTQVSLGTIVSAEQLALPSYASVSGQFIQFASVAWIDTEAFPAYIFSNPRNSMYIATRGF